MNNTINFFPMSSSVSTQTGGSKVSFQVANNSNEVLNLKWMDYNGNFVSYGTVNPGATRLQDSAGNHVWELTSDDGKVGIKFETDGSGIVTVGSTYQPTFTDLSEKIIQTPNGLWSTTMGYGLINVEKSLGIAHTTDLSLSGQNNNAALNAIHAPSAWDAGITGKGVKVAIVDSGIAANAEVSKQIVGGYDFQDHDTDGSPDFGAYREHSLGVASIIAGSHSTHYGQDTMGVAPDAQLLNVRVGSSQGSSSDNMVNGIHWAVDNGAKVVCMPLQSNAPTVDQNVANAVHYAYQHNVVVVLIGGNFSNFTPTGPALIAQQLKGEAIDVGNYDIMAGKPFDSSNMPGSNPFPWVMASSTGYVANSNGGYTYYNDGGTSFAGPYVAGLAALLWQQNPNATASQIIEKITSGAAPVQDDALAAFQATGGNHYRVADSQGVLALDVGAGQVGGEAYRLYQAAFDRAPDAGGLGYWINNMDHGESLLSVANSFVNSAEFQTLYGAHPSNTDLVNAMYHNVLHRTPDADGMKFWLDAMNHGDVNAASLLSQFSESAENVHNVAEVIGQGFHYTPYA